MRTYDQYCALARALDHVGHRWTLLILRELLLGPKRFTDLRHGLPGIANNLLADRLRQLQADGLVVQRDMPPPAASTVYELTAAGRDLREAVQALIRWGGRWMLSGPGNDHFRAEWLALALDALGVGARLGPDTVVELDLDGDTVQLVLTDGHLAISHGGHHEPLLRVVTDAPTILGVAAGALSPADALEQIRLQPAHPEAVQAFTIIFSPRAVHPVPPTPDLSDPASDPGDHGPHPT